MHPGIYPSNFDVRYTAPKLNLLIEFSSPIFIKFNFNHIVVDVAFKINYLTRFLLSSPIYLPSGGKKAKDFLGLYLTEPPMRSPP